jgi:cytochrome P450
LSKHPEALAKIRGEHDKIFGSDIKVASAVVEENPAVLNKLSYTLAVIKEALRLWPPIGGSYRDGRKEYEDKSLAPHLPALSSPPFTDQYNHSVHLVHDGKAWATYPWATFVNDHAIMRNEKSFRDPECFLPERYLVTDPSDPYFVQKDAFRAFEKGPRNCIGEAMALLQLKVCLVVTLRSFDICEMYSDADPVVDGTRMYQTLNVTAKPSRGMPVKVKLSGSQWS